MPNVLVETESQQLFVRYNLSEFLYKIESSVQNRVWGTISDYEIQVVHAKSSTRRETERNRRRRPSAGGGAEELDV